jgi:hypothetical protein
MFLRDKKSVFLIMFLLLVSCSASKDNIIGRYVAVGYENCYDTIWLKNNGTYNRTYIQKINKQKFKQSGKWSIWELKDKKYLKLDSFYMNDDQKIIDDTIFKNISTFGNSLLIKKKLNSVELIQNDDLGRIYVKQ